MPKKQRLIKLIRLPADFSATMKALLGTAPPPAGDPSTRKQKPKKKKAAPRKRKAALTPTRRQKGKER